MVAGIDPQRGSRSTSLPRNMPLHNERSEWGGSIVCLYVALLTCSLHDDNPAQWRRVCDSSRQATVRLLNRARPVVRASFCNNLGSALRFVVAAVGVPKSFLQPPTDKKRSRTNGHLF